jgi:hypothetical protein
MRLWAPRNQYDASPLCWLAPPSGQGSGAGEKSQQHTRTAAGSRRSLSLPVEALASGDTLGGTVTQVMVSISLQGEGDEATHEATEGIAQLCASYT